MATRGFHEKPYDDGTLAKLKIFELYVQGWIPVFVSPSIPAFQEVHIFDFFSGPGGDSTGEIGSPLRILRQLISYHRKGMASWNNVRIVVHLFDSDEAKIEQLKFTTAQQEWIVPGVEIDCRAVTFQAALREHGYLLKNPRAAKLLIIDQFGVDEVSDDVFRQLISFPTTDFIFFLSSSTLHRFRDHPAIKQKIDKPEDSYDVHRAAFDYYRRLLQKDVGVYLGRFSIMKRSNIYGLIFGSQHPLGIHKFLQVAWANDEIAGEANFDIDRENRRPGELVLDLEEMRPTKIREFEAELEDALRAGRMKDEMDVARFCIEAGMTCQHSEPILKKLKTQGVIALNFRVPNVSNLRSPRSITMA
jgi:three-Cys-motif partner protein